MNFYEPITQLLRSPILCHFLSPDQLSLLFHNYFLSKAKFTQHKSLLYKFVKWRHPFNPCFYYDLEHFYLAVSLCPCPISPLPQSNHCSDFLLLD